MENIDNYNRGLLFTTFLLINSDKEISDNELCHIHKMRVEEGMSDDIFADHFKSLIGKSGKEIYQIGIESLNRCSHEFKIKALIRLYQMATSDKVLNQKEVQFVFYTLGFSHDEIEAAVRTRKQSLAA